MININSKPWDKVRFTDIQKVLQGADGENFFFEFKDDRVRNDSLLKEISAFANTYGGYIFLGVSDDKSITGCDNWTEQKIHNLIYNGITPTPDFDVRKFRHDGKNVFVIKIEEGLMPPYITNQGHIYERVSSGSFSIKNSDKLAQLYTKQRNELEKLRQKLYIEELSIHNRIPQTLCAYLDLGFEIQCMDMDKIFNALAEYDMSEIATYLKKSSNEFGISSSGYSYVITLAKLKKMDGTEAVLQDAALNSFMVLMPDGSVKIRICLFADPVSGMAEVSALPNFLAVFREIYKKILQKSIDKNYIYARKYEKLVVVRQFVPYYDSKMFVEAKTYLSDHIAKYGNNLVLSSNRVPLNNFIVVDRRYMKDCGLSYTAEGIINALFHSAHARLGYIDPPNKN